VEKLRERMLERGLGQLCAAQAAAVRTLKRLLKSENEPIALGAARSLLGIGCQWHETLRTKKAIEELKSQLDEVEERRR
jgi:hypothetical protein